MESHGGDVELLAIEDGVARLRLKGSCNGCAASASTLELAIKQALEEDAPDLLGIEVEGAVRVEDRPATPLPLAPAAPRRRGCRASIVVACSRASDDSGPTRSGRSEVGGMPLVVANVDGTLLAYRDACAACGASLARRRAERGRARLPVLRAHVLPAARRALAGRRAAAARARCRCWPTTARRPGGGRCRERLR